MKKQMILGGMALLAAVGVAQATLVEVINYSSGTLNGGAGVAIPDANPAGIALSQSYTGLYNGTSGGDTGIGSVSVTLNISGGYNGDLYGYLVLQSEDGQTLTSILLNRVGRNDASSFGYSTSGFGTITLATSASQNIHDVENPNGGTYLADGRTVDPNGNFSGASTAAQLDVLNGHNVNGTWTLFLADLSGGDQATLLSWNLDVSVVPEPTTWALIGFGLLAAAGGLVSYRRKQNMA